MPTTIEGGNKANRVEKSLDRLERTDPDMAKERRRELEERVEAEEERRKKPLLFLTPDEREEHAMKAIRASYKEAGGATEEDEKVASSQGPAPPPAGTQTDRGPKGVPRAGTPGDEAARKKAEAGASK